MSAIRSLTDRSRKPSGLMSNPVILLDGGELTGKTYSAALLTASDRVGQSWMMQLGETDGDPYGAIVDKNDRPVRYTLVEHDGTWPDIMTAAQQIHDAGTAAATAGELPPVWIFDSMTIEWEMLSAWANNRAAASEAGQSKLAKDPNAAVDTGHMYWNGANRRHNRLITLFRTFPGIVVLTARGKYVTKFNDAGKPTKAHEYTLEAHKQLGTRCTAWVRLSREEPPQVIGARLPRGGVMPGVDRPQSLGRDWSLEHFVFEGLGYDPSRSQARSLNEPQPGSDPDPEDLADAAGITLACARLEAAIAGAASIPALTAVWDMIKEAVRTEEVTIHEANRLRGRYQERGTALGAKPARGNGNGRAA